MNLLSVELIQFIKHLNVINMAAYGFIFAQIKCYV